MRPTPHALPRRHLLVCLALPWLAACSPGARRHTITLAQLQAALAARFPRTQALAGGWQLLLQAPQLSLHPESNRLGALCPLDISGPLLRQPRAGELALELGLRYDSATHSLLATDVRVQQLRVDGLPGAAGALLQQLLAQWAEQHWSALPLYQLSSAEQERLQHLGAQPQSLTVTAQGLEVAF